MKVESKQVIKYNVTEVDAEVVSALVSIILNSTQSGLNKYLESLGARANIISSDTMSGLTELGNFLHDEMMRNRK